MADFLHNARTLVYLLACAVNDKKCELDPGETDFDGLYALAKRHAVCAAAAFALESAGIAEPRFAQAKAKARRKLGLFDIERARLYARLNEADIWFLPLKGVVMKDFYPRYGMREMSDNDILCDSSKMAAVREIMESLGFTCESFGETNHDAYQKPPTLEFEMHRSLFVRDETPLLDRYYDGVFDRLEAKGGCEYAFGDEDFYIYMLAHAYKHFSHNGTGLRSLLDMYVYLQKRPALDFDYIGRELKKLRLSEFEHRSRSLALQLFGLQRLGEEEKELLPLYLASSLYGTARQGEYNHLTAALDGRDDRSVKAKYLFDRVFLRGKALEKQYPFFAGHKWLLPVLYAYRPFKGLLTRPKGIAREIGNVVKYRAPKKRW